MSQQPSNDGSAELNGSVSPSELGVGGRRWLGWVGMILALGALGYYLVALRAQAAVLEEISWGRSAVAWIVLCVCIYPLTYAAGAAIWCLMLRSLGQTLHFRAALAICAVSQFGKYLPGNLAHHVGRIALARRQGLGIDAVLTSMLLETANLLIAGTLVAGLLLLPNVGGTAPLASRSNLVAGIAVGMLIVVAAALALLWRGYRQRQAAAEGRSRLALCLGMQCGAFLVHGMIAVLLVTGVLGLLQGHFLALTGMFAFAWVAGFVTPGAPAGIGVREAIISLGLAPLLGTGVALTLAALLRTVSILGDLLTFAIGLALSRR